MCITYTGHRASFYIPLNTGMLLTGTKPHQDILEDYRIDIRPISELKGLTGNISIYTQNENIKAQKSMHIHSYIKNVKCILPFSWPQNCQVCFKGDIPDFPAVLCVDED